MKKFFRTKRLSYYLNKYFDFTVPVSFIYIGKTKNDVWAKTFMNYKPHKSELIIDWDERTVEIKDL